ncbi:hypothetical protein SPONN_139 [uncultured Candidatus Thioglobus sp.]|nr:hypothetical protein SPONN_139 [uncultured Candidatus Thioglobus sp.]
MHEVTMRMSDKAFESLNHFVQYMPDVELVADNQSEDAGDEFKLDVDKLVKTAQRIKRGDVADFKVIDDIDQHLIEVDKEIVKL